ncbi:MAG: hypothetical protein V4721_03255 [Bacteroidota bacterium]
MVSNKINILRKYLLLWIIWFGIMVYMFREMLGMLSVRFVVFTDRLLNISDSLNPVLMWAVLGLLLGAIYGSLIATRKLKLDAQINKVLIGTIGFIVFIMTLVNRPLANSLIVTTEPDTVQVDSSAPVQTEKPQQPQEQKAIVNDLPTPSQPVESPKVEKASSEPSIREIKEKGGPVKVFNETGSALDLYISVYSNNTDSWKDYFLIHVESQGSPTINVSSDRYRYYVRSQDGGDKYSAETPYTVSAYDVDFATLIIK